MHVNKNNENTIIYLVYSELCNWNILNDAALKMSGLKPDLTKMNTGIYVTRFGIITPPQVIEISPRAGKEMDIIDFDKVKSISPFAINIGSMYLENNGIKSFANNINKYIDIIRHLNILMESGGTRWNDKDENESENISDIASEILLK